MSENTLNSNKASRAEALLVYSSSIGFADAIGVAATADMAGVLDAKIRDKINDFTDYTTVPFNITNGGAYFFGILGKLNNNYYSGLVWSYHASAQATTWQFTNFNGTYYLRPLAERRSWPT